MSDVSDKGPMSCNQSSRIEDMINNYTMHRGNQDPNKACPESECLNARKYEEMMRAKSKMLQINLCKLCCTTQAYHRVGCEYHEEPLIEILNSNLAFSDYGFEANRRLLENKVKIKNYIEEGSYQWYKPIYDTDIEKKMVKLNRQLNVFNDDDSLKRTTKRSISKIETKIFSF